MIIVRSLAILWLLGLLTLLIATLPGVAIGAGAILITIFSVTTVVDWLVKS